MKISKEEIKHAVESSGYLFEQDVMSILEKMNLDPSINVSYKDIETGDSREIDIVATKRGRTKPDQPIEIRAKIIIECKQSDSPIVFLTRNLWHIPGPLERIQISGFEDRPLKIKYKDSGKERIELPGYFLHLYKANSTGDKYNYFSTQFCKITKRGKKVEAHHGEINNSYILPLIKSIEYFKIEDQKYKSRDKIRLIIFYPFLVISGSLYSLDVRRKNLKPKEVNHVIFRRNYESFKISGTYFIDVVNILHFKEFLEKFLIPQFKDFCEHIYKFDKDILNGEITFKNDDDYFNKLFKD